MTEVKFARLDEIVEFVSGPSGATDGHIPVFDGSTGLAIKETSATISATGTLSINPTPGTNAQGLVVTQTSPASGNVSGPVDFNLIHVTNQAGVLTSGGDPLATHEARALHVHLVSGGPNLKGFQNAIRMRTDHTIAGPSDIGTADFIGGVSIAYSTQDATGHGLYSMNSLAWADAGASHGHMVGVNAEVGTDATAAVNYVAGFRSQKFETGHGAITDAAYTLFKSDAGEGWSTGILLNEWNSTQSIASTGEIMKSANALTIANGFKLDNVTFTSDFILTPHYKFTGGGAVLVNQTNSAADAAPTGTQMQLVSTGTYGLTLQSYNGGESSVHLVRADGPIAAKTALIANDLIGTLGFWGYHSGGAYSSNSRAAIFGHAAENWTAGAQGAYLDFHTTPIGSTTRARVARFTPAGGLNLSSTANTAAGSISGAGTAVFNGMLASGGVGVGNGTLRLGGNTSGQVDIVAQAVAGTPTYTAGTLGGTIVGSSSAPLAINSTTGNITIPTGSLTKADDTNVTLTLGGTPTNALINAVSLTLGWTGQLAESRGGTGLASQRYGAWYLSANQAYTAGSPAKAQINTEVLNNGGFTFDGVTNYRVVMPATGKYLISYQGYFIGGTADDLITARIKKNGTTDLAISLVSATSATVQGSGGGSFIASLAAGDYLELFVGSASNGNIGGGQTLTYMHIWWIGT